MSERNANTQPIAPIQVVGIGLDGAAGLSETVRQLVDRATVLVGSDRHLSYFPASAAQKLILTDFTQTLAQVRDRWQQGAQIVIIVSGDPLFFGLGRLLVAEFPPESLNFHPHLSSIQLAFNRIKLPWHDAQIISAHGRSLDAIAEALGQGVEKIAVLTDSTNSPNAIARLYLSLDLPLAYEFWVCENLGGTEERVRYDSNLTEDSPLLAQTFDPLNLVILRRKSLNGVPLGRRSHRALDLSQLPLIGLPDSTFLSFRDRPRLMTKREIRLAILGELALQPNQVVWDIGAGTGSVSIEIARLSPTSQVCAVEKTAIGYSLIQQNCDRLQVCNVQAIQGKAPAVLAQLPPPDRIFIGGSGGHLPEILGVCDRQLSPQGILVLAFATVEHLSTGLEVLRSRNWNYRLLQLNISRSVPVGSLTRLSPLNPVTLATAWRQDAVR